MGLVFIKLLDLLVAKYSVKGLDVTMMIDPNASFN